MASMTSYEPLVYELKHHRQLLRLNVKLWLESEKIFNDVSRAGEPANFSSGSGFWFFFERLRLRLQGAKKPAPAPDYW